MRNRKRRKPMLVIKVRCIPAKKEEELKRLHQVIVGLIANHRGHGDPNNIVVLFPSDLMTYGLGERIIIEIDGLNEEMDLREPVAKEVGKAVYNLYPEARVECFVNILNYDTGFYSSSDPNT